MADACYLVVEIRYLLGRYHGSEWPPAPMRLLQAWVAALRRHDHPALQWLEQQAAPVIQAQATPPDNQTVISYVDENSPVAGWPRPKTAKPIKQRHISQPLRYCWAVAATDSTIARQLAELASQLSCLGTGRDSIIARGWLQQGRPDIAADMETLHPWHSSSSLRPSGARLLRIPVSGSLHDVEAIFQAHKNRLLTGQLGRPNPLCREQIYAPQHVARNMLCLPLRLRSADGQRPYSHDPRQTIVLAGMLRGALMQRAAQLFAGATDFHDFIARHQQHDPDGQLSYLPLPSVGHQHADGQIRRVLLLAPVRSQAWLQQIDSLLDEPLALQSLDTGHICAQLEKDRQADDYLQRHVLASSQHWQSVTPIVLPGNHAPNERIVLKLIRKALREAGIGDEDIASIDACRSPYHPQAHPAQAYRRSQKHGYPAYCWHARIRFRRPLLGPLYLGRQRHMGLGLMLPANPEQSAFSGPFAQAESH
jgi:CRISPR-associated protein Csb2